MTWAVSGAARPGPSWVHEGYISALASQCAALPGSSGTRHGPAWTAAGTPGAPYGGKQACAPTAASPRAAVRRIGLVPSKMVLSIVFLLVLLQRSGARRTLAGAATLTGCAVLLSVVAVEAAMLEAVPIAAANGDEATVATGFEFASGVFVRIYPLIPAPLVFAGIGFALYRTSILPRVFARTAVLIAGLFLIAGLAAVFGTAGLIFATAMSVTEAVWILAAAIAFARTGRS